MPISPCRALAIRTPSRKARHEKNHMDTKVYVSTVREHGEHLRKLSTKLTATFRQLEQALDEQQSPVETNMVSLLAVTAELNNSLFAAMVFCQRLQVFLESTKRDNGSRLKN